VAARRLKISRESGDYGWALCLAFKNVEIKNPYFAPLIEKATNKALPEIAGTASYKIHFSLPIS
jgi:hypothetical protein